MSRRIPVIDYIECNGCGTCEIMCPDVFYLVQDKAWVLEDAVFERCDLHRVWRSCPARCISFVDLGD